MPTPQPQHGFAAEPGMRCSRGRNLFNRHRHDALHIVQWSDVLPRIGSLVSGCSLYGLGL